MNKFLALFLFTFLSFAAKSQNSLSDYSYVVVPDQFEFLDGKDRFQLNSMSEFYFNKYGFHAFMSNEVPGNLKRCDGIYADVLKVKAIIGTRVMIVLKDCNGNQLFESSVGKSKEKDFKMAFQDALRDAFLSIAAQNVNQKEIAFSNEESPYVKSSENIVQEKVMPQKVIVRVEDKSEVESENIDTNLPTSKFSNYTKNGNTYLLRRTDEGYALYQESSAAMDGLLLLGNLDVVQSNKIYFNDVSGSIFKATFDGAKNLIVQKGDVIDTYVFVR